MSKVKNLIIGLDGCTFDIIGPWLAEGSLPRLKELIDQGVSGELETVFPPVTGSAWSSFFTGRNPGKHGIYDFLYLDPDSYSLRPNNRLTRGGEDFWKVFNRHGLSTGLISIPMSYPPGAIDGYMVTGLMTPRGGGHREVNYTYPVALKEEIRANTDSYIIHPRLAYRKGRIPEIYAELVEDLQGKSQAIRYLMRNRPTDLTAFVLGGTDKIMHDLYHIFDKNHPYHDPFEAKKYGHYIKDYFKLVDRKIGEIIDEFCHEETLIMVMSDHGMGPWYKWVNLNAWLLKEGYIRLKRSPKVLLKKFLFSAGITPLNGYKFLSKLGFFKSKGGMQKVMFEGRDKIIKRFFLSWSDIDWDLTRAYSRGHVAQIFINKKGREPRGTVSPEQYDKLKSEIEQKLLQLKDGDVPVVDKLLQPREIYSGPYLDMAADILFMPHNFEYFCMGTSVFMSNRAINLCFGSMGKHRMNGIFIAKGKGVKKGFKVKGAKIVDIAANLLFYNNLPIARDIDGRVLEEIFEPQFFKSKRIRYETVGRRQEAKEKSGQAYSSDEEEEVKNQLKGLGYFG